MPLFRQQLLTQDPRYRYIVTLCNYFLATLFLGMIVLLSGVMLMTYVEQKKNQDKYDHERVSFAQILGVILLIGGCLFFLASFIVFIVASVMYVRTRSEPPPTMETQESDNNERAGTVQSSGDAYGAVSTIPA